MSWDDTVGPISRGFETFHILTEVQDERKRQDAKWGEQNHPNGTGYEFYKRLCDDYRMDYDLQSSSDELTWDTILLEEVYEALSEDDQAKLRAELLQVAAVAVAWIECIDRRAAGGNAQS